MRAFMYECAQEINVCKENKERALMWRAEEHCDRRTWPGSPGGRPCFN